jgi:hypothetical protein
MIAFTRSEALKIVNELKDKKNITTEEKEKLFAALKRLSSLHD